ncbi:MAG: SapC family protein [Ramlibacter sp.]|nr:SapC family protein [Ramlibacter sp.]
MTTAPPAPPRIVPLSRSAHAHKRWIPYTGYSFAMPHTLLPLVGLELGRAASCLPVVFAAVDKGFLPMALLGLDTGQNLFVGEGGEWLGEYVPAALRSQPFALGRNPQGQLILCIDEGSPLVSDTEGELFFPQGDELAAGARKAMDFLSRVEQGRAATLRACEALAKHGCIVPLSFTVKVSGVDRSVEGLYQAGETQLSALPDEAFLELRKTGALQLAYTQLLSLHKLPLLGSLATRRAEAVARRAGPDLSLLDKDGTFGFDALR